MANNKSAMKRMRTSKKCQMRNKSRKSELKSVEKVFRTAVEAKEVEKARALEAEKARSEEEKK